MLAMALVAVAAECCRCADARMLQRRSVWLAHVDRMAACLPAAAGLPSGVAGVHGLRARWIARLPVGMLPPTAARGVSCTGSRYLAVRGARLAAAYLVDPASSHMLVSKIKPCTSKFRPLRG